MPLRIEQKALFEALIEDVEVQTGDRVIPRFRTPAATKGKGLTLESALDQPSADSAIRALPNGWAGRVSANTAHHRHR